MRGFGTMGILLVLLGASGCGDDGVGSGNDLVCRRGENCNNRCSHAETICDTQCQAGSTCEATCQPGKDCDFVCEADATCQFDCTRQQCQAAGYPGSSCTCTGDCVGTCSGATGDRDAGGGGCVEMCGNPADPGYAACVAACGG